MQSCGVLLLDATHPETVVTAFAIYVFLGTMTHFVSCAHPTLRREYVCASRTDKGAPSG